MSTENEIKLITILTPLQSKEYAKMVDNHYRGLVFHLMKTFDFDKSTAEDVTQETFYKAAKMFYTFTDTKGKISTWLYTIAKNCAIDHYRKNKNRIKTNLSELKSNISEDKDTDFENVFISPKNTNADSNIINADLIKRLKLAFNKLSQKHNEIGTLYFIQEKTLNEISIILEMPLGTVKATIFRCRAMLQKNLKPAYKELVMS